MQLSKTFTVVLVALTSFVFAVPLNPQPLPPGEKAGPHLGDRSALPVKERITLSD
jgi:hypothetical protein